MSVSILICAFLRPPPSLYFTLGPTGPTETPGHWDTGHWDTKTMGGIGVPTYCNYVVLLIYKTMESVCLCACICNCVCIVCMSLIFSSKFQYQRCKGRRQPPYKVLLVNCQTYLWLELFCYFPLLITFPVVSTN